MKGFVKRLAGKRSNQPGRRPRATVQPALPDISAPGPIVCRICGGAIDARFFVKRALFCYAGFDNPDGTRSTCELDADPARAVLGDTFCVSCALSKPIDGLDSERLRELAAKIAGER